MQTLDPRSTDLSRLAGGRRYFTFAEARSVGFTARVIEYRVAHGIWVYVQPGVLCATPLGTMSEHERLLALTLSSSGWACRQSALALADLVPHPPRPHVIVQRTRRNLDRVVLHTSRNLPDSDLTTVADIPATTVERALIDCVHIFDAKSARRLITRAIIRRTVDPQLLLIRAHELRHRRRPGATAAISILNTLHPDLAAARNEWEVLVAECGNTFGLPTPLFNHRVETEHGPRFIDVAWPTVQFGIEYDGYYEHLTSKRRFEDDRWRDMALRECGWKIVHCNSNMLRADSHRIFSPIVRAFEALAA